MRAVTKVWNWIKEKLFGSNWRNNIYASTLKPTTTLDELAKILADDEGRFIINLEDYSHINQSLEEVDTSSLAEFISDNVFDSAISPERILNGDLISISPP